MQISTLQEHGRRLAQVLTEDGEIIIRDTQSALDLLMQVRYEYEAEGLVLDKRAITEEFFILSSGLAGEILQKYTNYGMKMAIYGDFSRYTSQPLRDFIRESNHSGDFTFAADAQEAIGYLAAAK